MAVSLVRCRACKGLGTTRGIGGIPRDCLVCDATGKVESKSGCETVEHLPDLPKVELVSLEQIFPGVTAIAEKMANEPVAIQPQEVKEKEIKNNEPKPIFAGYSDSLMKAILEENLMSGPEWKQKHKNNNELFITQNDQIIGEILDVRDRASIRELYALSKPRAPRKVNLAASQDLAAKADPQYLKYEKEMKAKAEQESKAKKKSGGAK